MYTEDQKLWAGTLSELSKQIDQTSRTLKQLSSEHKKAKKELKKSLLLEIEAIEASKEKLEEELKSGTWNFFYDVLGGYKGAPVALVENGKRVSMTIANVVKVSLIAGVDVVVTVIGDGIYQKNVGAVDGLVPINLIQAFESKNQSVMVLG